MSSTPKKEVEQYPSVIFVLIVALLLSVYQFYSYEPVSDYKPVSFFSESLVMLIPFAGVMIVQEIRATTFVCSPLIYGFSILFISLLTDTLDEVLVQPGWVTTVFEDLFQIIGYLLVVVGLWRWVNHSNSMWDKLHQLVSTDHLTGAGNLRYFGDAFNTEVDRTLRYADTLSLIMFNLDHFKAINDTHGHSYGDEVLKKVAQVVRNQIRTTDVFARIRGEEFVILSPSTDLDGAKGIAEKLRTSIEEISVVAVTASFGVANYQEGESMDALLKRSDKALYVAKHTGSNRIVTAA